MNNATAYMKYEISCLGKIFHPANNTKFTYLLNNYLPCFKSS